MHHMCLLKKSIKDTDVSFIVIDLGKAVTEFAREF